jgi:anaerobic magnesium-protoporphyrin IX monomethyl ester cyclase
MHIEMVCVEDALMNIGFRKMAAYARHLNAETTVRYIAYDNYLSFSSLIQGRYGKGPAVGDDDLRAMAEPLARADLVCFSSMSGYAPLTRNVMTHVRALNPSARIVWGGIHPIMDPDDAIASDADAICTGEGEFAFESFLDGTRAGRNVTDTRNFWFKVPGGQVIKNGFLPLMTSDEMTKLPLLHYGRDELIYEARSRTYRSLGVPQYLAYNGLGYNTIWSIGCPFKCTFCGNTKFIANDNSYGKLRHPSVQYAIDEVNQARRVHPHISTVVFHDDSFLALSYRTLEEFAVAWKQQVGLPFMIAGVIPNYVKEEKLALLVDAGMNRLRMGIQNGSAEILKFYDRPTPPPRILEAAASIAKFKGYMIPPNYDVIVDNPIETEADVKANLVFIKDLARPYTLNIFSLRVIPNTVLARQMEERSLSIDSISGSYVGVAPTLANCLLFILSSVPIPNWLFERWLAKARPLRAEQAFYPTFLKFCRLVYLARRAFDHLRFMDFSVLTGHLGYTLWQLGIIGFWRRHVIPKFLREPPDRETSVTQV